MKMKKRLLIVLALVSSLFMNSISVYAASDLNITAPGNCYVEKGNEVSLDVVFSGIGIGSVGLLNSSEDYTAEFTNVKWNPYPNDCVASIKISTKESFTGGTLTFELLGDNYEVIKSQDILLEVLETAPQVQVSDLNIEAESSYLWLKGTTNTIPISFSGIGINSVTVEVSGEGLSSELLTLEWNAYPNKCNATVKVIVSENASNGVLTFNLYNDDLGVIKQHSIQINVKDPLPIVEEESMKEYKLKNGYYIFRSKLDENKVMDIKDVSMDDKASLQIWSGYVSYNQIFYVKETKDGYYTITAVHSGKVVDVDSGSSKSGTKVWQYSSNDSDAQKWKFYDAGDGYVYIVPKCAPNTCLDVKNANSANGSILQIYTKNQKDAQKWNIENVGKYKSDINAVTFKGSMVMECDVDLSGESKSVKEGVADDIIELLEEGINEKDMVSSKAFYKFMKNEAVSIFGAFDNIESAMDYFPTFTDNVEMPTSVAINIRQNDFENMKGIKTEIIDDEQRITYITFICPVYGNTYNLVMFEIIERKSWGTWSLEYLRMTGGFSLKVK